MQIQIKGKQIDLGDALREHVADRLDDAVVKYFGDAIDASVTLASDAGQIRADCAVHVGHDIFVKSHAMDHDPYKAFDDAAARIEKQLRRYKRRLRDHHTTQKDLAAQLISAQDYIVAPVEAEDGTIEDDTPLGDNPAIIAETRASVPTCSVSDAVMRLDLTSDRVLMFKNMGNDRLNVVYRRDDGNIGWIDPQGA